MLNQHVETCFERALYLGVQQTHHHPPPAAPEILSQVGGQDVPDWHRDESLRGVLAELLGAFLSKLEQKLEK